MRKSTIEKLLKGDVSPDLLHEIYLRMRDIPDKKVLSPFGPGKQVWELVIQKVLGPRLYTLDDPVVTGVSKYLGKVGDSCSIIGETLNPRSLVIERNGFLIRTVDDMIIKENELYEDYRKGNKITKFTLKLAIEC